MVSTKYTIKITDYIWDNFFRRPILSISKCTTKLCLEIEYNECDNVFPCIIAIIQHCGVVSLINNKMKSIRLLKSNVTCHTNYIPYKIWYICVLQNWGFYTFFFVKKIYLIRISFLSGKSDLRKNYPIHPSQPLFESSFVIENVENLLWKLNVKSLKSSQQTHTHTHTHRRKSRIPSR